jgi:hypothetical protein
MTIVRTGTEPGDDGLGALPPIYVEVDDVVLADPTDLYADQQTRGRATVRVLDSARDVFEDGVELARTAAARFAEGLIRLPAGVPPPAEVELQIAIKLDAEFGAVLAKATAGAQMQVTIRWDLRERS